MIEPTIEQTAQLDRFSKELYAANTVMNLTRIPREEFGLKHVLDSLLLSEFVREGADLLDIGTGAGFPAWPLACCRPDIQVTAIDSFTKAITFLETVPLPNLRVVKVRAEDCGWVEKFDVVTGRALAPLPIQLEISAAACRVGGLVVPMRTPAEEEAIHRFPVELLGLELGAVEMRPLPGTDIVRCFPVFLKIAKTPGKYPRTWAEIRRQPLA